MKTVLYYFFVAPKLWQAKEKKREILEVVWRTRGKAEKRVYADGMHMLPLSPQK